MADVVASQRDLLMTIRRTLASVLAFALALTPSLSLAQQQLGTGALAGKASDEVKPPYGDYTVLVRNVATGQPVATKVLDQDGKFSFPNLELNQRYLIELVQTKQNKVLCTEGPYGLVVNERTQKLDVNIDCGKPPALLYILLGGAATAALLGNNASGSR
jgi:hypothetical protein